jgi:hypothetical protein
MTFGFSAIKLQNHQKGEAAMTPNERMNPKKTARIAGFLYLLMAPFAILGILYVPNKLIVPGDAATTAKNIMTSESLFRLGIASALITHIIGIFVVLVLYKLLKPVNKTHALLMVVFLLVSVPIAILNELNHFAALVLLSGADYFTAFEADQLQTQVMYHFDLHEHGIAIASIFWGLWLFPMGYLVFKSGYIPRILGIVLFISGFGYLIDFFTFCLFPDFGVYIGQFTGWGEILFPLWLLIKGVDVEQWEKRALEKERR